MESDAKLRVLLCCLLCSLALSGAVRAHAQAAPEPLREQLAKALQADIGRASDDEDVTCDDLKTEPIRWGLLILGSEPDLATAETRAREISRKTGVRFSKEGFSIHPKTKRPKYRRTYEGEYAARTSDCEGVSECLTIESSSAYSNLTPNLFIIVGAVLAEEAPPSLAKYRAAVPDSFVKYSTLTGDPGGYGATSSCMDWDVIVLARTERLEEAEAIARLASAATGIPYTERSPKPAASDYYDDRKPPFPNISVESDNAYGEGEESSYFLVVGGVRGAPENPSPKLLKRYQKLVPNAYRMKRARHICGA